MFGGAVLPCSRIEPRGCDSYRRRAISVGSVARIAGRARTTAWFRHPPERLFVIQPERAFGVKEKIEQVFAPNA